MNREHVASVLNGIRDWGSVELLTHSEDPRERLFGYLDDLARMDEAAWPEENVKSLYDDIMDIFKGHPEAEAWFREWRAAHLG